MITPPPPCRCEAILPEGDDRTLIWSKIRGRPTWPLLDPAPLQVAQWSFRKGRTSDLDSQQLAVLFDFIAHKRGSYRHEVQRDLQALGWYPIVSAQVRVANCQIHGRSPG